VDPADVVSDDLELDQRHAPGYFAQAVHDARLARRRSKQVAGDRHVSFDERPTELEAAPSSEFGDLHFNLVEFSAWWLVSYLGFMDWSWRTGTGQDPDWWLGFWDDSRPPHDQPAMGRLFAVNGKWPWPLKPSEYVQRQIHVQFADDPVAVKARHITGLSTIMWGNDYPHAEGTFRGSEECIAENFEGVSDSDRAAILGGTLAGIVGFDTSKKLAPSPAAPAEA